MSDREKDREAVRYLGDWLERYDAGFVDAFPYEAAMKRVILALARAHLAMLDAGPVAWGVMFDGQDELDGCCVNELEAYHYGDRVVPLYALPEDPTP